MGFGLEGEELGMWKGICYTASAMLFAYAFWPDVRRHISTLWHILFKRERRGSAMRQMSRPQASTDPEEIARWRRESKAPPDDS